MGVSRTTRRTEAPISLAVEDKRRVQHTVCSTTARLARVPSPNPLYPTLRLKQITYSFADSLSVGLHQIGLLLLYYTVLSRPVLSSVPPHTHTHMHTYVFGPAWFFGCVRAGWTHHFEPDKSPPFQSLKKPGLLQLHLNRAALRCTALAPQTGIGLDGGIGLGCRASERAKRLSYCAARLVSLSLSHHWVLSTVHFQISTHWVPPSIPTRLSTPPPRTRLRHLLSSSLSSLHPRTHLCAT